MKLLPLLKKTFLENIRDWKILILAITFAPFFVVIMHFYFGDSTRPYRLAIINNDAGLGTVEQGSLNAGRGLIADMKRSKYPDGKKVFQIKMKTDLPEAEKELKGETIDLIIEIPDNFSKVIKEFEKNPKATPAILKTYGSPSDPHYIMATIFAHAYAYQYTSNLTGQKGPLDFREEFLSTKKSKNEFDLYVPGLLVMAMIMLIFTAAASLIKEKDKATIIRLRLSKMSATEFFASISIIQIFLGLVALGLTYYTAVAVGYQSSGQVFPFLVIGIVSCMGVIALSIIVAGFLRTIFDLMTIGCFPFFILMFFSGGMFPLPSLPMFSLGERVIHVNDILPTTHSYSALNRILNFQAKLSDVAFELGAIIVLTFIYASFGLWLFKKRHLQPQ
jgi:ABC-2 type transport system permease protein